jgi:squalene synthase HpnC
VSAFRVRGHSENFPVGSILLPRTMRPHVAAVYAFARTADDFADEGSLTADERCRLLDGWRRRLHHAAQAADPGPPPGPGEPPDAIRLFLALGSTIRERNLPIELFEDLLSAFRQDVTVARYATWTDLFDYCRRSANPVGRIVLRIAGLRDDRLDGWSDAICTALQLTNFWQDLSIDAGRGRLYVPLEEIRAHDAEAGDLTAGGTTPGWTRVLDASVRRTRALFHDGRPLCEAVAGRLRYELRATWLGGIRILDRLEQAGFDVAARRPVLRAVDLPWFVYRMASWPLAGGPAGRA